MFRPKSLKFSGGCVYVCTCMRACMRTHLCKRACMHVWVVGKGVYGGEIKYIVLLSIKKDW